MTRARFAFKAIDLLSDASADLIKSRPGRFLAIVQKVIEDLTSLVEEYEGVLDEHHDPGVPPS